MNSKSSDNSSLGSSELWLHLKGTAGPPAVLYGVPIVLGAAIFSFDLAMPLGVASGVPNIALVLLGLLAPWRGHIFVLAAFGTVLTIAGYFFSAEGSVLWVVLTNRALALFAIWVTAVIVQQRQIRDRDLESEIAARKEIEQSLIEGEERIRAIVDTVVDGIITINQRGQVITFNPSAERIFGYSADEIVGTNVKTLMPEPDQSGHDRYIRNYLGSGEAKIIGIGREVAGRRKDGVEFPMALAVGEFRYRGEKMFVANCHDISLRKQHERQILQHSAQLEAANEELDAFAYSVSHDLRSPLRALDGFSQALVEDCADDLNDEGRDYLDRISKAAQRMGNLIDDLLTLSRLTRSQMQIQVVNLSTIADEILQELSNHDPERKVSTHVTPNLTARGDPTLLRVVLDNLLRNAWKFTSKQDRAEIEFGTEEKDGGSNFFVRDDGVGFNMEYVDKLFGAFQRLHSTAEFEGTGIGLATVARLVHRHGGKVWAEGVEGQGATLHFTLGAYQ